jgi:aspartate aminotransferase-like enzyme
MNAPQPTVDAARYAAIEDRLAALFHTHLETIVIPGEAILALEAIARGVGGPRTRAVNVVTGPYGAIMGHWLGAAGGQVRTLESAPGRAIESAALAAALEREPADVVCVVHAEAATGVVNPLAELAAVTHDAGAALVVDAVASVGAEPLELDALRLDATVIGPQKAMGGPAGVCALFTGDRIWELVGRNPVAPRNSILSLLDQRERWTGAGRQMLPFVPHSLEMLALDEALTRLQQEGIDAVVTRHRHARDAARAGLAALGLALWVADDDEAAAVATLARPPHGLAARELVARIRVAAPVEPAPGALADEALRVMHNGPAASLQAVLVSILALGDALAQGDGRLDTDVEAALAAAESAWSQPRRAASRPSTA